MKELTTSYHIPENFKAFTVRRSSGKMGGSHYYHHAHVVCKNREVLEYLVKNELIDNWRRIDRFDESDRNYTTYEIFGEIDMNVSSLKNHKTYILE